MADLSESAKPGNQETSYLAVTTISNKTFYLGLHGDSTKMQLVITQIKLGKSNQLEQYEST